MRENNKAGMVVATISGSNQNQINAGDINKHFDVSDYAENLNNLQCEICRPPLSKGRGAAKLCPGCQIETERTAATLLDNFARHRKVIKVDCFCFACQRRKTSKMMFKLLPICRNCADELQAKGATARNNFISRTTNNFFINLKKAVQI